MTKYFEDYGNAYFWVQDVDYDDISDLAYALTRGGYESRWSIFRAPLSSFNETSGHTKFIDNIFEKVQDDLGYLDEWGNPNTGEIKDMKVGKSYVFLTLSVSGNISKIIKINKGNGEFSYISSPDKPYSIELVSDDEFFISSKENGQIYHYKNEEFIPLGSEIKGFVNGKLSSGRFNQPYYLTLSPSGDLYFIDEVVTEDDELYSNYYIRKLSFLKDADNDGVYDDYDNCIYTANSDQKDTDGDGIGDICDTDDDGDDINDEVDLCDLVADGKQGYGVAFSSAEDLLKVYTALMVVQTG